MRAVLQRTSAAYVTCGDYRAEISRGLVVLLGIEADDDSADLDWLVRKVLQLRIFGDAEGKMNLSLMDIAGELLVVSQFTLHASTRKGNRPSFVRAAPPGPAERLYEGFCEQAASLGGCRVARGIFGGEMEVGLVNDGPVTIVIDSRCRE